MGRGENAGDKSGKLNPLCELYNLCQSEYGPGRGGGGEGRKGLVGKTLITFLG